MQVTDGTRVRWPLSVGLLCGARWLALLCCFVCGTAAPSHAAATGEVIVVPPWWAKQAALSVDGRPSGSLPQKLLLPEGAHKLVLQQGKALLPVDVSVKAGRATLVRWPRLNAPEATLLNAVGLVIEPASAPASVRQAALAGIHAERLVALGEHGAIDPVPMPAACGESAACLEELTSAHALRFVVSVQLTSADVAAPMTLRLFDSETGDFALQRDASGPEADLGKRLAFLVSQALRQAPQRPLGLLEISSQPAGAEVLIDGRKRGVTPYRRPASVGEHDIVVHKTGYQDYLNTVDVLPGRGSAVDAILRADTPAPIAPTPSSTRPPATAKR